MGHLWDSLSNAYEALGFDAAVGDEGFRQLVIAWIIEPTSKADAPRVLAEAGIAPGLGPHDHPPVAPVLGDRVP